jgi:tetraacyldisaccharide 4'-kinase
MSQAEEYLYNLITSKKGGALAFLLKLLLFALSLVYASFTILLAFFYRLRPAKAGCKVISVGNITLGGTGKTCIVEYLALKLGEKGIKTAVISRGYKRDPRGTGTQAMGDEPAMLKKKLPQTAVIVDSDRLRAADRAVKEYGVDTAILDDGMQQWRIHKDLEIVAIDALNPFGNCRLLPAGFLREPLSALRRADVFILTRVEPGRDVSALSGRLSRINPGALIVESRHRPQGFGAVCGTHKDLGLDSFKGAAALVFSGIGNPRAFEETVVSLGVRAVKSIRFSDHHRYTQRDMDGIVRDAAHNGTDIVITTEKDAVKIAALGTGQVKIFSLNVKLEITRNEAELDRRLFELYPL